MSLRYNITFRDELAVCSCILSSLSFYPLLLLVLVRQDSKARLSLLQSSSIVPRDLVGTYSQRGTRSARLISFLSPSSFESRIYDPCIWCFFDPLASSLSSLRLEASPLFLALSTLLCYQTPSLSNLIAVARDLPRCHYPHPFVPMNYQPAICVKWMSFRAGVDANTIATGNQPHDAGHGRQVCPSVQLGSSLFWTSSLPGTER
ncbi:hypothetical protein ONZ45_g15679 [Pleurotus djamor]|nr:hypothetical protein ONZ45_g15679 [Pleurotus djamor]